MNKFIHLNRKFSLFTQPNNTQHHQKTGNSIGWGDLLKNDKVIILAEAGTGKTDELKAISKKLKEEKEASFFCRIEELLEPELDFEDSLNETDLDHFLEWKDSSEYGYFFLDSVDEAKLQQRQAFMVALKKFVRAIEKKNLPRAKIFVTSRFSEWRKDTDLKIFNKIFHVSKKKQNSGQYVYSLNTLNDEQILAFAAAKGIAQPRLFLDAIERADSKIFANRPQDLLDLIEYWQDKGKIGRHIEMLQYSIEKKLIETNTNRSQQASVSFDDAYFGVQRLAAATTFLKKNKIRLEGLNKKAGSISPFEVLPEWNHSKLGILLTLPIFDKAIYGAIRFHHRSVREFLTAKWLYHLLNEGGSRSSIESLLVIEKYGQYIAIPSMRSISAWLACWDKKFREKLRNIAPQVLIEFGDPSEFPLEFRINLLDALILQYQGQHCVKFPLDPVMMKRLATPDMAQAINSRLKVNYEHNNLCKLLLNMVWHGYICGSVEEVVNITLIESLNCSIRRTAFRTVFAIGTQQQKQELLKQLIAQGNWGRSLVEQESNTLLPEIMSIDKLIALIEGKSTQKGKTKVSLPILADWDHFVSRLTARNSELEYKCNAFNKLLYIYREYDPTPKRLEELNQLATDYDLIDYHKEHMEFLSKFDKPKIKDDTKENFIEVIDRQKREKEIALDIKWKPYFHNNSYKLKDLTSLKKDKNLKEGVYFLYNFLRDLEITQDEWTGLGLKYWKLLIPQFGNEVAENFRDGCINSWRLYPPITTDIYLYNDIRRRRKLALTGIAMEANQTINWTTKLNNFEARQAIFYTLSDLEYFPSCLYDLQHTFPDEVKEILLHQVKYLLKDISDSKYFFSPIINTNSEPFWEQFGAQYYEELIDLLENNTNEKSLALIVGILKIMLINPMPNKLIVRLSCLAQQSFLNTRSLHVSLTWLVIIFQIDATKGLLILNAWLTQLSSDTLKEEVMAGFLKIFDKEFIRGSYRSNYKMDYERLEILEHLIPLVFQYLRLSSKDGYYAKKSGNFTRPPEHTRAQSARGHLLYIVENTEGRKSHSLLKSWAQDTPYTFYKDYLLNLAKKRAEFDSEFKVWTEKDIPDFEKHSEKYPKNEEELYQIAIRRLSELKHDLENADDSIAPTVQRIDMEIELRNLLAHELSKIAKGRYEVTQEEEMTDGKRTDIRFHYQDIAPIPCELKIADKNWSYNKLKERMENQLINQYMKTSQYGIFLLVYRGINDKYWVDNEKNKYSFSELLVELEQFASYLINQYKNVNDLKVVGIDLSIR